MMSILADASQFPSIDFNPSSSQQIDRVPSVPPWMFMSISPLRFTFSFSIEIDVSTFTFSWASLKSKSMQPSPFVVFIENSPDRDSILISIISSYQK